MATTIKTSAELFGTRTSAELFGDRNEASSGEMPLGDKKLSQLRSVGTAERAVYNQAYNDNFEWDTFVPPENQIEMRGILGEKQYEDSGKRTVNSLYFSDITGTEPEDIYGVHDQFGEVMFGVKDSPTGYFKRIGDRLKNGKLNIRVMDAGHNFLKRYLRGERKNPEQIEAELDLISKLQSQLNQDELRKSREWHEKMLGATAEQLPFLWEGIKGGARGAIVGAGTGAGAAIAIGALIPAPEEVLTVPGGAIYGAKVGGAVGAGSRIAELKSGELFTTLLEMADADGNKIDPKIAAIVALSGGIVEGAIEVGELAVLASTFGIGTKVFESAARKITTKFLAEGTLKHIITKHLLKFGATLTAETAQELVQEASSVFHEELAKEINNRTKGTDIKSVTAEELRERFAETTIESLRGFALLVAPGPIITGTKQAIAAKAPQKPTTAETDVGQAIPPIAEALKEEPAPQLGPSVKPLISEAIEPVPVEFEGAELKPGDNYIELPEGGAVSINYIPDHLIDFHIEVFEGKQGKGVGTKYVNKLKALSDKLGIPLQTEVLSEGTASEQLFNFFSRLGFEGEEGMTKANDRILTYTPAEGKVEVSKAEQTEIEQEAETVEQAIEDEELTLEETSAIKRLEAEVVAEDAEVVSPNLYIGNMTRRMKKVLAGIFKRDVSEIEGFVEEGFPTKRTKIKMTRKEAAGYLEWLENDLLNRLENNKIRTENELATANADWGDIVSLRETLGLPKGARPFKVIRPKKRKGVTVDRARGLSESFKKAELVAIANDLGIDSSGTKAQIIRRLEDAADAGMTRAQRIVSEAQETAKARSIKVIKDTKALIKFAIRPTEESKLTVGQVLGTTMKRMAQAARTAFSKGGKEARAKLRAQLREAKERLRFKKALEKRVRDLVKRITKPANKDIEYFYRKAIEVLQAEFDPKTRSIDTKRKIQKYRDFLKRATPEEIASIPEKKLIEWGRKNYEDFTVAELEGLSEQITLLRQLGKAKQTAIKNQEKKAHDQNVSTMTENITGSPDLPDQPAHSFVTDKEGRIKKILSAHLQALRIPRILDWLDGKKGTFKGLAHQLFYGRTNEQYNAELVARDKRATNLKNKQESLGIITQDLTRIVDFSEIIPGKKLMVEEMMGIYTALKNNLSLDALENGNGITQAQAQAIVSNLEQKYKDLADYIIDDYAENYDRLRNAHIDFADEDMGREANYTPIVRLLQNDQVSTDEISKQLQQRAELKRGYEEKGFVRDRKNITAEHQQKMDIRLVTTWHGQMAKQEHYIHFASLTKDMRTLLADPKSKLAITNKLGKEGLTILNNWVDRVANPNIYKGMTGMARWSRIMRGNVALAYLAYNLTTVAKQIPSMILYMADTGPQALITSTLEFIANPSQMWKSVREKDPQVKHVHLERELEEFREANQPAHNKIVRKVGLAGMKGILVMDGIVRTIGWNATYQKNLDLGMSETEAIREAQNVTLRTQPAAQAKDIANLYASDEYLNWFTMFTNQLNQIYNIVSYDVYASWNNKNYQLAAAKIFGVSLNALVIWSIANKQLPSDEEDLLDAGLEGFLNIVPLVGKALMSAKKGYGANDIAPFKAVSDTFRFLSAKDKEKAALRAIESLGAVGGFPVIAVGRMIRFLETGDPAELFGKPKKEAKGITL